MLILSEEGVYAARGPAGHWPLVLGVKDGAVAAASESGGFANIGFKLLRDVEPGEIVLLKNGQLETKGKTQARTQVCSFYWVYTGFPNSVFEGLPSSLVRKRLGAALARRDIERGFAPDVVIPVPDSGRFHAIGYHQEFCRQAAEGRVKKIPLYDELLLKYPYAGRSFIPQDQKQRDREARVKQLASGERLRGPGGGGLRRFDRSGNADSNGPGPETAKNGREGDTPAHLQSGAALALPMGQDDEEGRGAGRAAAG